MEGIRLSPKSIKTILAVTISLFVIIPIVVAVISNISQERVPVEIDHQGIESSLPDSEWRKLELSIYRQLQRIFDIDDSIAIRSIVRENSYEEHTDGKALNISFLIDIDEYKQTYEVAHSYSKTVEIPDGTTINCPSYDKMKYPGEKCIGMTNTSDSIEMYLPYTGKINSGEQFIVKQRRYFDGKPYIEIAINSCGDQSILDEALTATKDWMKSINVDPELFSFEIPTHYCPGEAH